MRVFLAFDLPDGLKKELFKLVMEFKSLDAGLAARIRWVASRNQHITLKFLGDVSEEKIAQADECCERLSSRYAPFQAEISGLDAFPSKKQTRVIWVGIRAADDMRHLWEQVENDLFAIGIERDPHGFSPHITLGRNNSFKKLDISASMFSNLKINRRNFMIGDFKMYKSELGCSGPEYTLIKRYLLGAKN